MYGYAAACKRLKVTVGGSLLPLIKNEQYSNLSTRSLTIWLELSMDRGGREQFSGDDFKNLKVT